MSDLDERLNNLEIKYSYQDELLKTLNLMVAEQQVHIERLQLLLKNISEQSSSGEVQNSSLKNERPPHY